MIEQFFKTMIVASSVKSGYNDPSKSKCWKLFRATLTEEYWTTGSTGIIVIVTRN